METVFVSGATGFIGSRLSCDLVKKGYKVYALSFRGVSKNKEFNKYIGEGLIEIIVGDVSKIDVNSLPKDVKYIYHVAGKVAVWGKKEDFIETNVVGTRNMLEYAKMCDNLECFVYFSSVAVYGFCGYKNLEEGAEFAPMKNNYPVTKIMAEEMVRESNKNFVIVRPGNVYGEYDYTSSYDIYKRVKNGKMLICGKGQFQSCFVYVGNLTKSAIYLAENEKARNSDYNITDGNNYTLKEVLCLIAKEFNVPYKVRHFSAPISRLIACCIEFFYKLFRIKTAPLITKFTVEQNLHDYSFSMKKTLSTGFEFGYTTEEGIKNTVLWFNSLPENEQK